MMNKKFVIPATLSFLFNLGLVNAAEIPPLFTVGMLADLSTYFWSFLGIFLNVPATNDATFLLYIRFAIFVLAFTLIFLVSKTLKRGDTEFFTQHEKNPRIVVSLILAWATAILLPANIVLGLYAAGGAFLVILIYMAMVVAMLYVNFEVLPAAATVPFLAIRVTFYLLSLVAIFSMYASLYLFQTNLPEGTFPVLLVGIRLALIAIGLALFYNVYLLFWSMSSSAYRGIGELYKVRLEAVQMYDNELNKWKGYAEGKVTDSRLKGLIKQLTDQIPAIRTMVKELTDNKGKSVVVTTPVVEKAKKTLSQVQVKVIAVETQIANYETMSKSGKLSDLQINELQFVREQFEGLMVLLKKLEETINIIVAENEVALGQFKKAVEKQIKDFKDNSPSVAKLLNVKFDSLLDKSRFHPSKPSDLKAVIAGCRSHLDETLTGIGLVDIPLKEIVKSVENIDAGLFKKSKEFEGTLQMIDEKVKAVIAKVNASESLLLLKWKELEAAKTKGLVGAGLKAKEVEVDKYVDAVYAELSALWGKVNLTWLGTWSSTRALDSKFNSMIQDFDKLLSGIKSASKKP